MNKVILFTGIAASGKTTLSSKLIHQYSKLQRIGFGDFIKEKTKTVSYEDIRKSPTKLANASTIKQSKEDIAKCINQSNDDIFILDSHAVVEDYYGFRIIPEIASSLRKSLLAIILINPTIDIIQKRIQSNPAGRNCISDIKLKEFIELQMQVAVTYSISNDIPLYVLSQTEDITEEQLLSQLDDIFMDIGIID